MVRDSFIFLCLNQQILFFCQISLGSRSRLRRCQLMYVERRPYPATACAFSCFLPCTSQAMSSLLWHLQPSPPIWPFHARRLGRAAGSYRSLGALIVLRFCWLCPVLVGCGSSGLAVGMSLGCIAAAHSGALGSCVGS